MHAHFSTMHYQSTCKPNLKRIQKSALSCIFPGVSYKDNPYNKIYRLLPMIFYLHKTKTKRFTDTFINESSSMAMFFMTCSLHFKIFNNEVISNVFYFLFFFLAKGIFRFVKLLNSFYSAKLLNNSQSMSMSMSMSKPGIIHRLGLGILGECAQSEVTGNLYLSLKTTVWHLM